MNWDNIPAALSRWYTCDDRGAARDAFQFLEQEFRLMVPALVRRTWPTEDIEDGLREVLSNLIENPLDVSVIESPRAYFSRILRNHFVDLHRARQRKLDHLPTVSDETIPLPDPSPSVNRLVLARADARLVSSALARLSVAERVVLKLEHAPEWLDDEELAWLSGRGGLTKSELLAQILAADDMHALSRIFDPGDDDPDDAGQRRHRMERFRRRRSRARERLLVLVGRDE